LGHSAIFAACHPAIFVMEGKHARESFSAKAYRQPENKKIHSNFEGVKIGLIE
jgi:hypothetical protein